MNALREACFALVGPICGWGVFLSLAAWAAMAGWRGLADERARLLDAWRPCTVFGRAATLSFVCLCIVCGAIKPDADESGDGEAPAGPRRTVPDARISSVDWNATGAWKYSMRKCLFPDGFVFPCGEGHLDGVHVSSQGYLCESRFTTNVIAALGVPVAIVPGLTEFASECTPSNSCRFCWTDAAANRDTNALVTGSIELFRNGDVVVTTNGVARTFPRELPFAHDGYGQDGDWVRANFSALQEVDPSLASAEEVLSIGYTNWVDAQVGVGLTNGLYKFTASFAEAPPEATRLFVGDWTVCVTNAGEYVFVLEKGTEYEFGTWPFNDGVDYWAQDDLGADAPMRAAWWGGWESPGEWTVDGGGLIFGCRRFSIMDTACGCQPCADLLTLPILDLAIFRRHLTQFFWTIESLTLSVTSGPQIQI